MSRIWYGLAVSLAYPNREEEGNFPAQMISTCLGVGSAPCDNEREQEIFHIWNLIPDNVFIHYFSYF
jgi:hypothetical protein